MAARMEEWDASDFYKEFHAAATSSPDEAFRRKFDTLAKELEPFDREFFRETSRCGRDLGSVMEGLKDIAGRAGYCRRPRGFEQSCEHLFQEVDETIGRIRALRETCFV
ncbi:MAG: hypothetical protein HY900_00960 [Deltaproteobacteria bacterium]|nr:hypothetical protein [Deltaproteobacteria bacterium]